MTTNTSVSGTVPQNLSPELRLFYSDVKKTVNGLELLVKLWFVSFRVFFFTDSQGSPLYIFYMYPLYKWHMMKIHFSPSPVSVFIIVLTSLVLVPQQSAWSTHGVRSFWKFYRLTVHHSSIVTISLLTLAPFTPTRWIQLTYSPYLSLYLLKKNKKNQCRGGELVLEHVLSISLEFHSNWCVWGLHILQL